MASTTDGCSPNVLTVHKLCCEASRIYFLHSSVGICVLQLSSVLLWNLGLLISVGLYSLQRIRCVLEDRFFFIVFFRSLTSQSHGYTTEYTLRTISMENSPLSKKHLDPSDIKWIPYRGGRGKEKQLCCLNIIKAWDSLPLAPHRSWG